MIKAIDLVVSPENFALPQGSLILVTGANGYIGANVVREALDAGYKVRGTTRSGEKSQYTEKVFDNNPSYSTTVVAEVENEGAWDEAMKDVNAVVHMATDTSFSPDPNQVVSKTEAGVLSILRSAAKTPSVKRFVLTSSSSAVLLPQPGKHITVGVDDWNDEAEKLAWAPPPYKPERAFPVYAASKAAGEKAFWKFIKEEKPGFVGNTILPNFNVGRILTSGGPTGSSVSSLLEGKIPNFPPQYHIDVIDDARIHLIAAALDSTVSNERIFTFAQPFTFTEMIGILKKLRPDAKSLASPPENEGQDLSKVPNELGAKLLKQWYGQEGYKTMKQSIEESLATQQ
ncbi:Dihydroflavonol-4-reductase [Dactylellina cionopaga]|nr:Dihydroflavonol-4-reductase [Dactylellina cionopaga]